MSFNISRLTLYALLSSIEEDLRSLVVTQLGNQTNTEQLLGSNLWDRSLNRLKRDVEDTEQANQLPLTISYVDYDDLRQLLGRHSNLLPSDLTKYLREIDAALTDLVPIRNRVAHTRPLHPSDLSKAMETASRFIVGREAVWHNLEGTINRLKTEPSFVVGLKIPVDDEDTSKHNLPIPDFDETGFVGREKWVNEVTRKCLTGAYPVITIMGDGGIGKTALALKVAYDVLDRPDCPYEAIVWVTSKTLQLTTQEITKIRGAISDSLGVFQHVAERLAGVNTSIVDPLQEVLDYMQEFKILLILDNLETVLDGNIRAFLGQLPVGSKVLITSRVGIGAWEDRVNLKPMEANEAIQLLRALAEVRDVSSLTKMPNSDLQGFCKRMHNNPGWIKWFVSAVQVGERPESILASPELFLNFCMSNVYRYLPEDSRTILTALTCLPGKHSQAELAFLSDMEPIEFQRAIQQLMTTNFMTTTPLARGNTFETYFELADLARTYLRKHHAPANADQQKYQKRKTGLIAIGEQAQADQKSSPYNIYTFSVRSKNDWLIVKYLRDALDACKRKHFDDAEQLVTKARTLSPDYYEVHRVDAWLKVEQSDYSEANTLYQEAIQRQPKSAPLHFWYGGFLLRHIASADALEEFEEALRLDPTSADVQVERIRAKIYLKQFSDVEAIIKSLLDQPNIEFQSRRKRYDLLLQYHYRYADHLLSTRA